MVHIPFKTVCRHSKCVTLLLSVLEHLSLGSIQVLHQHVGGEGLSQNADVTDTGGGGTLGSDVTLSS